MRQRLAAILEFLRVISLDPVGATGVVFATLGGSLFVILVLLSLIGVPFNQYIGIFIYMGLPAVLVFGLVLIPIGRWRVVHRYADGKPPKFDLTNPRHQRRLLIVMTLTVANVLIFGVAAFEAFHLSESNEFCGTMCHKVMSPEWTAFQDSPHSRVGCVKCHIGPGAGWFVRSKLSGARQVIAVALDSYTRPIETPVHNLRPARDTCEQCHWPEKFHGDRINVLHRFQEDEENTELMTVLAVHVGGGTVNGEPSGGIHWHTNPANRISYVSTDHSRLEIPWVRLETHDGEVEEYLLEGYDGIEELRRTRKERSMDCIDCHNRPTHIYELPNHALDEAMKEGRIDKTIPWIRREGLRALETAIEVGDDPEAKIRASLAAAYAAREDVELADGQLDAVAAELTAIWSRNVFPEMGVTWGTYPNFRGHEDDSGCFRCHDGMHTSASGRTISDDCDTCHAMLAWEEEGPPILEEISYGSR